MTDPIGAAIEAAVQKAIEAQLPKIIAAVRAAAPVPQTNAPDEFVPLPDACKILGIHRSTAARLESAGKLPPRRRVGSKSGYLRSDLAKIMGVDAEPKRRSRSR